MRRLSRTINFREKEKEILDQIIGSDRYDSRIRPAGMLNDTSKPYISYIFSTVIHDVRELYSRCSGRHKNQSLCEKHFANWRRQNGKTKCILNVLSMYLEL